MPGLNHPPPELMAPIIASLCLHLLLAAGLMFWMQKPREVVWVDLLEARLIPAIKEKTMISPPPARTLQTHRPTPALAKKPDSSPANTPVTHPPEPSTVILKTAAGPVEDLVPREKATTGSTPTPVSKSPVAADEANRTTTGDVATQAETAEQRYAREQFAYIRERVTSRLVYPPLARRQGWSGEVRISFIVQADGSVEELKIAKSSGRTVLDQQALRAVQVAAPFPPPPVPAGIVLPVLFSLETASR